MPDLCEKLRECYEVNGLVDERFATQPPFYFC